MRWWWVSCCARLPHVVRLLSGTVMTRLSLQISADWRVILLHSQVLADLRAGLKALRATIVNPSIEEPPVVVGPTWPMKSTPASEGDEERPTKRQRSAAGKRSVTGDNNARMHPGTGYAEQEPDFAALAARDADLAPFVRTRPDGRWDSTSRCCLF